MMEEDRGEGPSTARSTSSSNASNGRGQPASPATNGGHPQLETSNADDDVEVVGDNLPHGTAVPSGSAQEPERSAEKRRHHDQANDVGPGVGMNADEVVDVDNMPDPPTKKQRTDTSHQPPSSMSVSHQANGTSTSSAIDLTQNDTLPSAGSIPASSRAQAQDSKPAQTQSALCIGSLDTQALVLYPSPVLSHGWHTPKLVQARDVRVDAGGEEWLRVKLKYRKAKIPAAPAGDTWSEDVQVKDAIIVLYPTTNTPLGQLNDAFTEILGKHVSGGICRCEGFLKRSRKQEMFTLPLNILIMTLPSNVKYLATYFDQMSVRLDTPMPYYDATFHSGNPAYLNPHNPPPRGGFRAQRNHAATQLLGGPGRPGKVDTVDAARQQVDEVFESIKGADDLPETDPGPFIKTRLFPHQKKAITFMRQREGEKDIKDKETRSKENSRSVTPSVEDKADSPIDVDTPQPSQAVKDKKWKKKKEEISLWEPVIERSRIVAWKNKITDHRHESSLKPREGRGSILADDMGLGKTLTVISLIASTRQKAHKWGKRDVSDYDSDLELSDSDDEIENGDLTAAHFAGRIHNMPTQTAEEKRKQDRRKAEKKARKDEGKARHALLQTRSRATLLICPLSTVHNWEDQIKEHWAGPVVFAGKEGSNMLSSDDGEKKKRGAEGPLRVLVYYGPSRPTLPSELQDYDIVITTYSTLQTEFSKQMRIRSGDTSNDASAASTPRADDTDSIDVDEDGTPYVTGSEKPEVAAERRLLKQSEKDISSALRKAQRPNATRTEVSPLQAVEWFRIVLDEAHFIKDPKTIMSRASCYLEADRRICLTGTPIQNKLDEVWALLKFLRLSPFDDRGVWTEHILSLTKAGDSRGIMRMRSLLKFCTLRRTKDSTHEDGTRILQLPPRIDRQVMLEFNEQEQEIYNQYFIKTKKEFLAQAEAEKFSYVNILQQILRLRQICDHWSLVNEAKMEDVEAEILEDGMMDLDTVREALKDQGVTWQRAVGYLQALKLTDEARCVHCAKAVDLPDFDAKVDEDDDAIPVANGTKGKSGAKSKGRNKNEPPLVTRCGHVFCNPCFRSQIYPDWPKKLNVASGRVCAAPKCNTGLRLAHDVIEATAGAQTAAEANNKNASRTRIAARRAAKEDLKLSSKMHFLLTDLQQLSASNRHSVNYDPMQELAEVELDPVTGETVSTKSIIFIESMLEKVHIEYARLDGTMRRDERTAAMDRLKNDPKCEVLLVSLRAGGVGLNLTAATRCYLIDPYWNPSVENQAVDRVHRLGQTRPVTSIKLIVKNSIEEKMLALQKKKAEMAQVSLSQKFSKEDLHQRKMEELRQLFA